MKPNKTPKRYRSKRLHHTLIFCLLSLFLLAACSQLTKKNSETSGIKDMVLIYNGGAHRTVTWDEEHFAPYVSYSDPAGKFHWLFDGFLFLEIKDGNGRGYASGYEALPARKEEWISLIRQYLNPGNAIQALNSCIEQNRKKSNIPFKKRKIVISLPEPIPNQKDWGELNGKNLDFSKDDDRIEACKWYIDFIIAEINRANMKNIELSGFYWLAEEATNTRTFVNAVADYIHEKKFRFYWIPYFQSDGYDEWKTLGFDQAFLQPNHFFNNSIPDSRIDKACELANKLDMSMEMEFDERATEEGSMGNRLKAYIEGFRRNNIFDSTDIAYYQGDHGLYLLKNGSEKDRILYNELAEIIVRRQQ